MFRCARSAASCHRSFCPWLRSRESICSSRSLMASGSGGGAVALQRMTLPASRFPIFVPAVRSRASQFVAGIAHLASAPRATGWPRAWRRTRDYSVHAPARRKVFPAKPAGRAAARRRVVSRMRSDIRPTSRSVSSGIFCTSSGKCDDGNRRTRASVMRARAYTVNCFIRENGRTPVTFRRLQHQHERLAAQFAARLQFARPEARTWRRPGRPGENRFPRPSA